MTEIILIAHNLRSSHNVGSLLRTADGLGVGVFLTGYTPYPLASNDKRLPHQANKINRQIQKTALGAEASVQWQHDPDIQKLLTQLRKRDFKIVALEQSPKALPLPDFTAPAKIALIVGRETEGLETSIIEQCHSILEIPMLGKKESFNVAQAAAMALYHLRYRK